MANQRNNAIAESAVAFYSAGGHSHDGVNSSIIDTTKYSIFDFSVGRVSTNSARVANQNRNIQGLKDFIISTVNSSFLEPSGIVLQDNIINARNIISGSITAEEIAANTITGDLIRSNTINGNSIIAGSITADRLEANALVANSIIIGANDYWAANGYFRLGGTTGISYNAAGLINIGSSVYISGDISGASGTFSGGISATTGNIAGWTINSENLTGGGTFLYSNGTINANIFRTASTGPRIEMGPGVTTADEIFFYDSGGTRSTIRNPGSGEFRISTSGGTYTFGSQMLTTRNITANSFIVGSNSVLDGNQVRAFYMNSSNGFLNANGFINPGHTFYNDVWSGLYLQQAGEVRVIGSGVWGLGVQFGFPIANLSTSSSTINVVVDTATARLHRATSKRENKENIKEISNPLDVIRMLSPKEFTFKSFDYDSEDVKELRPLSRQYGFIAEEVADVSAKIGIDLHESEPQISVDLNSFFSHLDIEDKDELYIEIEKIKNSQEYKEAEQQLQKSIKDLDSYVPSYWKHPHIIALAVAAIKELSDKIDLLESKIEGA